MQLTPITTEPTGTAQPSRTWKIDFEKKKIMGTTDGLDALRQAVFLCLSTQRYEHAIYSRGYGVETKHLPGQDYGLARKALEEAVRDALSQDDRIESVGGFSFSRVGDTVTVSFSVTGTGGTTKLEVSAVV